MAHFDSCNREIFIFSELFKTNMGLINKVDMVCLSPMGYGVIAKHNQSINQSILFSMPSRRLQNIILTKSKLLY